MRYPFVVDGTPNDTFYIIWCWKGEYWNLGAGAEIGIYYNEDSVQAEQGYYKIEPENLKLNILMNVDYLNEKNVLEHLTTNFSQTNWWVTSFTPRIQRPVLSKLQVALEVNFAPSVSYQNSAATLWNSFYSTWNLKVNTGEEQNLSWGPIIRLTNHNYCGEVPCVCSAGGGNIQPCCKHTDNLYNINY